MVYRNTFSTSYGTILQYGMVILQYCMVHNLLSIKIQLQYCRLAEDLFLLGNP